jgi:hypothetical protein
LANARVTDAFVGVQQRRGTLMEGQHENRSRIETDNQPPLQLQRVLILTTAWVVIWDLL